MPTIIADSLIAFSPLIAQSAGAAPAEGRSLSISWAIVLFFTILGLIVTLSPARRTYEIKKPRED